MSSFAIAITENILNRHGRVRMDWIIPTLGHNQATAAFDYLVNRGLAQEDAVCTNIAC